MKVLISIFVVAMASIMAVAEPSLEQLRAKMDSSTGGNKAKFAMEIAERQVELADNEFDAGNSDKGHALVREITELVRLAGDASLTANKRVKNTEIAVRKVERRLQSIYRDVSFDDQDEIDESLKIISTVRNQLLDRMFGLTGEDKDKNK